jgi:hypothetical protein
MHNVKRIVLRICKSEFADDHTNVGDHATSIIGCVAFFFLIRLLYAAHNYQSSRKDDATKEEPSLYLRGGMKYIRSRHSDFQNRDARGGVIESEFWPNGHSRHPVRTSQPSANNLAA